MRAMCTDREGGWTETRDLDEAEAACRADGRLAWIEVDLTSERDEALGVAERFGLDALAVEDAFSMRQRPKLESYDEHQFLVLFQLDEIDDQLEPRQLAAFAGGSYVLVLHGGTERLLEEARGRVQKVDPEDLDVERALHALIDTVVDDYERTAGRLDVDIEDLEAKALAASKRGPRGPERVDDLPSQELLYSIKQQVSSLRRYALPLTGVVDTLQKEEERRRRADDDDRTDLLFRDVADHVIRLEAQVGNIDDLANAVVDLTRSLQADILNEVNKKLSAWAAIIAIPTLIASIYGTNYKLWPPPGESKSWGFLGVVLIMVAAGGGLWLFFKRKRWI